MIESISVTNFKLFKERTTFDHLKKINLLTGVNGRGKSTFLQSMLLVKQTLLQSSSINRLILNGSYISLGNALDVKNDETSREQAIEFSYKVNGKDYVFSYQANERDENIIRIRTDKSDLLFEIKDSQTLIGEGFARGTFRKSN